MADSSSELVVETHKLTKIYQNRQIALNDVTLRWNRAAYSVCSDPTEPAKRRFCAWSSVCTAPAPVGSRCSAKP